MASLREDIIDVIAKHFPEEVDVRVVIHSLAVIIVQLTTTQAVYTPVNAPVPPEVTEEYQAEPDNAIVEAILTECQNDPLPGEPIEPVIEDWGYKETKEKRKKAKPAQREEINFEALDDDIF